METKKFNPKLGAGFGNDAFGKGSIKVDLDAEGIKSFIENAQVGGSILLRFNKKTSYGNDHYFAEILPPYDKKTVKETKNNKKVTSSELD